MANEEKRIDSIEIWGRIEAAGLARGLGGDEAYDVAFHMMDWVEDLKKL